MAFYSALCNLHRISSSRGGHWLDKLNSIQCYRCNSDQSITDKFYSVRSTLRMLDHISQVSMKHCTYKVPHVPDVRSRTCVCNCYCMCSRLSHTPDHIHPYTPTQISYTDEMVLRTAMCIDRVPYLATDKSIRTYFLSRERSAYLQLGAPLLTCLRWSCKLELFLSSSTL